MMKTLTFLDEETTSQLMSMAEAVAVCESVLEEMGRGQARLAQPSAMFVKCAPEAPTLFKVKGGYLGGSGVCGFRIVGDIGEDGIGGENHFCYLVDPQTAAPLALVAQTKLHRMRTAACGLITLKRLTDKERPIVAIIGAGRIASHVVEGFASVFPTGELIVASRRYESAQALAATGKATAARSAELAVAQADAVLTLTSAHEPVISLRDFRPGVTICGMGENGELPADLFHAADRFIVDDIAFVKVLGSVANWIRSGGISEAIIDQAPRSTIGEIVAGRAPGRTRPDEKILAIVQGLAIADLAMAKYCVVKAASAGLADAQLSKESA
jgi:alanine dehydrogenase